MLAYQMIYTACGKDKSGAFSVWAKSANVTSTECDEIIKLMSYIEPEDAPYRPTPEQIQSLFPKKYAFFVLSSGRKCFAQTSYIGKVYSDLDPRSGNFIIHAFLTDDLDGFNPFSIIGADYFKTCLTYKEWHDEAAPDDLPAVEIKSRPVVNEAIIKNYILGSQRKEIGSFLQAIINNLTTNNPIIFNDSEANQATLYSLIGTMLPLQICGNITFCNQATTQLDYTMSSAGMQSIKLRNIFVDQLNNHAFNYSEELDAGSLVFNFEQGICSSVQPKRYLSDIIQSLDRGNTLFSVLTKIDTVNNIIRDTSCDVDTAIAIYYIIQKDLAWFSGVEEYTKAFDIALQHHYIDEKAIAVRLYNDIILTGKWGRGQDILPLMKFAYTYNGQAVKESIMDSYFGELQYYGVNVSAAPSTVLTQVKDNAPFPWSDFIAVVVHNQKWDRYVDRINTVSELYFVFDAAVLAVAKNYGELENKTGYNLLVKVLRKSIIRKAYDEVQLYFDCASKLGDNALNWLVETSLNEYLNRGVKDEATLDFVFRVICALEYEQEKIKLLGQLITSNMQLPFFMQTYIKFAEQHQNLFARIENTYKNNKEFSDFLFRKDAYVFKNATKVTYRSLEEYFCKYYQTGYDSGVYLEKVKQYLSAQTGKSKVAECMRMYDQVKVLNDSFADVLDVIEYIDKEVFSLSMEDLLNFAPMYLSSIVDLNNRLVGARRGLPEKYEVMRTILLVRGKIGEDNCQNCVQRNALYDQLNRNQLVKFVDNHFNEALDLYFRYKKKKYFKTNTLLLAIFDKPLASSGSAKDSIIQALEKLGGKEYYELMADIMAYAFNGNDRFASTLMVFSQRYIEAMNRGDYKKLFKKVVENMPKEDVPAVQKYIDKFLEEHKSFFEKLFSKKK